MSKLLKGSAIYTAGTLLRQLVSFLMLPIYTRHLTASDYGTVEMLTVITAVLAVIAGTHMGTATIRHYHEAGSETQQKLVICTASITTLITTCAIFAIFLLLTLSELGPLFSRQILGNARYLPLLQIFASVVVLQPMEEQIFTLLRIKNRPWIFVVLSLAKLVLQLSLNIHFVVIEQLGVKGVVYSSVISTTVSAVGSFIACRKYSGWCFSSEISFRMLKYIIPLAFGGLGGLFMSISDRYAIQLFRGSKEVGLYALGYRFADILNVLGWLPFINIWQAYRFEIARNKGAIEEFQYVFYAISVYLVWIGLGVALLSGDVLRLMAEASYWSAGKVVAPLILASLLTCAVGFSNFSFLFTGRTAYIAKGSWLSAFALTLAFYLLIPRYGAVGAAWAKVSAGLVQLVATVYWSRSIYSMNLPWFRVGLFVMFWALVYVAIPTLTMSYLSIALSLIALGALPITIFWLPILPLEVRQRMKATVSDFRYKFWTAISSTGADAGE